MLGRFSIHIVIHKLPLSLIICPNVHKKTEKTGAGYFPINFCFGEICLYRFSAVLLLSFTSEKINRMNN